MNSLERTIGIVAAVLRIPRAGIGSGSRLDAIAPLDSLSLAEIASALDDEFGIRLPGEDLVGTMAVGELAALVDRAPRR